MTEHPDKKPRARGGPDDAGAAKPPKAGPEADPPEAPAEVPAVTDPTAPLPPVTERIGEPPGNLRQRADWFRRRGGDGSGGK